MKRFIFTLATLLVFGSSAYADGVKTQNVRLVRNGDFMVVDMDMDLTELKVKANRAVIVTPALVNGENSFDFSSVGVYGRKRYFYYVRDGKSTITGSSERSFRKAKRPDTIEYSSLIPYKKWMEGSNLVINNSVYGCCNTKLDEESSPLVENFRTPSVEKVYYTPEFLYVKPHAESRKVREIKGSAYIDYPVNEIKIYPNYRNNTAELNNIFATIDSVSKDEDIEIVSLSIKGFASPEGSYQHNTYLAKERTNSLMNYVQNLYHFNPAIVHTDYEPEDWIGLRNYVENSNIANKSAIIDIIDSGRDPDRKNWKIKDAYPEQYRYLLDNVYPGLRHSDYRVEYIIRKYSDVEEIKRVLATAPQKLSLNELYLVANSYESGSKEFLEVFEVAVRMYPNDQVANLNAANSAMHKRDLESAKDYLKRAGNSPEAVYARAAYAALIEDYDTARKLYKQAEASGVAQATTALAELEVFIEKNK